MKGYVLRGQSTGVMHEIIFLRPPTEDEVKEALARELRSHGAVWGKDEKGQVVSAGARERWVLVQETEIVGLEDLLKANQVAVPETWKVEDPKDPQKQAGILDRLELDALLVEAKKGPPQTWIAGVGDTNVDASASVVNPGDPGWVDGSGG